MGFFGNCIAALALLAAGLIPAQALDSEDTGLGPASGEPVPHNLSIDGSPGITDLSGQNGIALYFIRSVDWCPYCQAQVIETSAAYDRFTALGLEVVFLSYDDAATQADFAARRGISGVFVSDPDSEIIKAFGLLNEQHMPGSFGYGIPHPAVFIVDPDGTILAKLYEDDYRTDPKSYRERPATELILETAAAALGSGG